MAALVQGGLPAGAVVLVQDNLRRGTVGGARRALTVRTAIVPSSGILTVEGLPDSNYALLFPQAALTRHAILSIDVGDRSAFPRVGRWPVPPQVVLELPVVSGLDVTLAWRVQAAALDAARFVVETRLTGDPTWETLNEIADPLARSLGVRLPLQNKDYDLRVKALNAEGRFQAASNVQALTTGVDPNVPTGALASKDTVAPGDIDSNAGSLTKVSGGILTGSGSAATLPAGKTFNASAGKTLLRTFTSMPQVGSVDDGEWFAVTAGSSMGIYVRTGTVAMNGAGVTSSFSA